MLFLKLLNLFLIGRFLSIYQITILFMIAIDFVEGDPLMIWGYLIKYWSSSPRDFRETFVVAIDKTKAFDKSLV